MRCLVFDFDGVLVDSNELKRNLYFEVFQHIPGSRPVVSAAIRADMDGDRYDVIRSILQKMHAAGLMREGEADDEMLRQCTERYGLLCEEAVASAPETPECTASLERLSGECPLYVNSATPEEPLRRVVRRRDWEKFFKAVFGRPRTKLQILHAILEREGIPPHELAFVGDSPRDRSAAIACGCTFIAFLSRDHQFEATAPNAIKSLSELLGAEEGTTSDVPRP